MLNNSIIASFGPTAATPINTSKIYNLDGYNLSLKLGNVTLTSTSNNTAYVAYKTVKVIQPVLTGPS